MIINPYFLTAILSPLQTYSPDLDPPVSSGDDQAGIRSLIAALVKPEFDSRPTDYKECVWRALQYFISLGVVPEAEFDSCLPEYPFAWPSQPVALLQWTSLELFGALPPVIDVRDWQVVNDVREAYNTG